MFVVADPFLTPTNAVPAILADLSLPRCTNMCKCPHMLGLCDYCGDSGSPGYYCACAKKHGTGGG